MLCKVRMPESASLGFIGSKTLGKLLGLLEEVLDFLDKELPTEDQRTRF